MAISTDTIRKITIQAEGKDSVDAMKASVDGLSQAQTKLASTSSGLATITDTVTKRQLSAQQAYDRQTMSVDKAAASHARLLAQVKILDSAMSQGIVKSTSDYNDRLALLQTKYGQVGAANEIFHGGLQKLGQMFGVVTGAAATFGVALGAAALVQYGKSVFDSTAGLKAQAEQVLGTGGNVEALQALRAVFAANGISADEGDKILARLNKTLGDAANGSKQAQDAFLHLGLGSAQLAGKSGDAALPLVVDQLLKIHNAAIQASEETAIFGKSGQQLNSALTALHRPMQDIIDDAKATGQVIDESLIAKADEAKTQMTEAFNRLSVSVAPVVTQWAEGFAEFAKGISSSSDAISDLTKNISIMVGAWGGAKLGSVFGPWGAVIGAVGGGGVAYAMSHQQQVGNFFGNLGLSSEGYDVQGNYNQGLMLESARNGGPLIGGAAGSESIQVTGTAGGNAKPWTLSKEDQDNLYRYKETFDSYLKSLNEAARLDTESAAQKQTEEAVVKAADIDQIARAKNHKVLADDVIKTYAQAVTYLGQGRVALIDQAEAWARINTLVQQQVQQIQVINAGSQVDADHRALVLKNLQDEITAGVAVGDQYKAQRAEIEANNKAIQDGQDANSWRDYITNLKEESSLAGLSADERERQSAVLQAMHMMHGNLSADQAAELAGIIQVRQETERWRQVVDGIAGAFQDFFDKVLTTGKASFGDLWNAIKAQFAQMLAWMTAQALINPIIVPMVEGLEGLAPGTLGAGGTGGTLGTLGMLGNLGSLGSASGLSDALGLGGGGWFNGLGTALGFAAPIGGGAGAALSLGSIAGAGTSFVPGLGLIASPGSALSLGSVSSAFPTALGDGTLFGSTTLGGFLGGAGLGSLASTLLFGNKNDASLGGLGGSAIGAAIGSIIPGIGTLIGGLAGGLLGGGLGSLTGSSNQGAIANFTGGGTGSYLFKQGGGNNGQAALQATQTISQAITTLQAAGVDIGLGNITGLSIGSDKSYVYDSAGGKQKLDGGDVQGVVDAVLTRILPSAAGNTPEAQAVLAKYNANGGINSGNLSQLESDLGSAKNFADAVANLKTSNAVLDDATQKLNQINSQYDTLVGQAQQLGIDIGNLTDAKNGAIKTMLDGYIQQLGALGTAANDNASQWQQWSDAITTAEKNATEAATALGSGLDDVASAAEAARQGMAQSFNSQIADAILQISDPSQLAYNQMLATQTQRLDDATAAGADLNQVYKLNALEQQQFSDQQQQALAQQQAALLQQQQQAQQAAQDQVNALQSQNQSDLAAIAQQVSDAHNTLADAYNNELQGLQATIDKYGQLSQSLRAYLTSLGNSSSAGATYASTKTAFSLLAQQALSGDQNALGGLQQAGTDFLSASKTNSTTLAQYSHDRALVSGAVAAAIGASDAQVSSAQDQLTALNASVQGLITLNTTVISVRQAVDNLNAATAAQAAQTANNTAKLYALMLQLSNGGDALITTAA